MKDGSLEGNGSEKGQNRPPWKCRMNDGRFFRFWRRLAEEPFWRCRAKGMVLWGGLFGEGRVGTRIVRVQRFRANAGRNPRRRQPHPGGVSKLKASRVRRGRTQFTTAALLNCSTRRAGRVVFIHAGHTVREDGRRNEMQILRLTTPKLMKAFGAPFAQNDTRSGKGCGFPPMLRMDGAPG